jgi:thiol-disulfide isomerase/thioredoxin
MVVGGCALALALFLYGMMGPSGKEEAQTKDCAPLAAKAEAVRHAAHGEVAALTVPVSLQKFTDLSFQGPQEQALHLTDFRGKWLLLNIWATWCVPCREEIPALDHLQEKLGSDHFEVVTINIDTAKLERREAFFQAAGVKHLRLYADPTAQLFQILRREGKVLVLPTTFLLSPNLCHIGTMQGGGNWSSDEALGLIAAALR